MKKRGPKKRAILLYKGHYCCVVNCHNSQGCKNVRFFSVTRKRDLVQTEKWIKAIDRKNPDGTPWIPGKKAIICEKHFIHERMSTNPVDPGYVPSIFPVKTSIKNIDPDTEFDKIEEDFNDEMIENGSELSEKENDESAAKKPKIITVKPLIQHIDQKHITKLDHINFSNLTPKSYVQAQRLTIQNLLESLKNDSKKGFKLPEEVKKALDVVKNCDIEPVNSIQTSSKLLKSRIPTLTEVVNPNENSHIDIIDKNGDKFTEIEKLNERKNPPFKCSICGNSFTEKRSLIHHISAIHKGMKPFKCSECNSTFSKRNTLNRHVASVHEGKKPFKCSICNHSSSLKGSLKKHIRAVHEKKKQFMCSLCGQRFTQNSNLKGHIESVHEGKKPFKCPTCDYSSYISGRMKDHISAVHDGKKEFLCSICGANYASATTMKRHIFSVHERKKTKVSLYKEDSRKGGSDEGTMPKSSQNHYVTGSH